MMKRKLLFILVLISTSCSSQNKDSLLVLFPSIKDETQRLHTIYFILRDLSSFENTVRYHKELLEITRKQKDKLGESAVSGTLGYYLALSGNMPKGTELLFEALEVQEDLGSDVALGMTYCGLGNLYSGEKKKSYYHKAVEASIRAKDSMFLITEYLNLAALFFGEGKLDSAQFYNNKSMEISMAMHVPNPGALRRAGSINNKLNRKDLALSFWRSSLNEYNSINQFSNRFDIDPIGRTAVYSSLSQFYLTEGTIDSALYYAKLTEAATRKNVIALRMTPAHNLWQVYKKISADSALKYATEYYTMKDSLYSNKKLQEMELMAFLDTERQEKQVLERKNNLQYAAIALGLVVLLIVFLLLSHSVVANQRLIRFLGIMALLIVFEFLNLFLHPYIGEWTHHSPVLMLVIMVGIAGLLIPLHHKLEHWIIHRLVEKNKKIRLTAAKKTIQQLEGNQH